MPSKSVPIRFSDDLLARIDKARAGQPRAAWIKEAVKMRLESPIPTEAEVEPAPAGREAVSGGDRRPKDVQTFSKDRKSNR